MSDGGRTSTSVENTYLTLPISDTRSQINQIAIESPLWPTNHLHFDPKAAGRSAPDELQHWNAELSAQIHKILNTLNLPTVPSSGHKPLR